MSETQQEVILYLYLLFVFLPFIFAYICNHIDTSDTKFKLNQVIVMSLLPIVNFVTTFIFMFIIVCQLYLIFINSKPIGPFFKQLEDKFENKRN